MKKRSLRKKLHLGHWSSTQNCILAASGAAIGLNNIWQFPYVAGQYGGGLFLLAYIVALFVVGLPLLMSEFMVGRLGKGSPIQTIRTLVDRNNGDPNWFLLGSIKTFTGFWILSYLSVIAGWTIAYFVRSALGTFEGLTEDGMNSIFTEFVQDPEKQIFWHSLFMVMTMTVVARGIKRGFEPVVRLVVPLIFVLLFVMLIYSVTLHGFGQAIEQIFYPDIESFSSKSILMAMGHAFFSLGLGFGVMLMYGAYLSEEASVTKVSLWVIGLDTLAGILAAIIIYSLLFSGDQVPVGGPALIFQAVPLALDQLSYSQFFTTVIFLLLALTAWMTAIGLIEPAMAWLMESHAMNRFQASLWAGFGAWLLGIVTILSFNYWAFDFNFFGIEKHLGIFDFLQIVVSNFLLPVAGMLIALYVGWSLNRKITYKALKMKKARYFIVWFWSVRLVTPVLLLILTFYIPSLFL